MDVFSRTACRKDSSACRNTGDVCGKGLGVVSVTEKRDWSTRLIKMLIGADSTV